MAYLTALPETESIQSCVVWMQVLLHSPFGNVLYGDLTGSPFLWAIYSGAFLSLYLADVAGGIRRARERRQQRL